MYIRRVGYQEKLNMILQLVHSLIGMEMKTIGVIVNSTVAARDQKNNYYEGWGGLTEKRQTRKNIFRTSGIINVELVFSETN